MISILRKIEQDTLIKIILVLVLILAAIIFRLAPHPANFAPIAALALFGGAILPRKWALMLPLTAMILTDMVIGLHGLIFFTWGSFVLIALFSNIYLKKINFTNVFMASLGASLGFYLVTNFGVWLQGQLYPMTIQGLISSYINAIPFFRNTLLGDLFYSGVFFGSYALIYKTILKKPGKLQIATLSHSKSQN